MLCSAVFAGVVYLGGQSVDAFDGPAAASSGAAANEKRANKRTIRFNARDQRLARAAVLRKGDLGRGAAWKGGATKVDFSDDLTCADYRPKVSDLVVTGAAKTDYSGAGLRITSQVEVLQTPRMVRLEWKRTYKHPNLFRCVRRTYARGFAREGGRFVSFRRTPFPRLAPYSARYRVIARFKNSSARRIPMLVDQIFLGRGRQEVTLLVAAPLHDRAAAHKAEVHLAKLLLARLRAATPSGRPIRSAPANQVARGLTMYEVPGEPFRVGIPPDWEVMTANGVYGRAVAAAARKHPDSRWFRKNFGDPGVLLRLVAVKAECGGGCSSLGAMALPRTPDWRPRAFEAGAVFSARQVSVPGTRPKVKRIRLAAGRAVRIRFRARTPFGVMATTQYVVHTRTTAYILNYATPPKFARRYAALFDRSARSLREP